MLFFVVLSYYHFGFGTRELAGRREKRFERSWKGNTGRSASKGIPQAANTVSPVFQVALLYHDAMFFSVSMIVAMVITCATRKGENVSRFIQNISGEKEIRKVKLECFGFGYSRTRVPFSFFLICLIYVKWIVEIARVIISEESW